MRLDSAFYRLPLRFDAQRLQSEIDQFSEDDWCPHPQGFPGNSAMLLVSAHGDPTDDSLKGLMRPTPLLKRCAYLQQVMAALHTVLGRSRLMRLAPHAEASRHMDANYYWHQRMRIHVPIRTHPEVAFHCGDSAVHMAEGECWIFDTWRMHNVLNATDQTRVHLVIDTVGSARLFELIAAADRPHEGICGRRGRRVPFREDKQPRLAFETVNWPRVMSPWEQESLLRPIVGDLTVQTCADLAERQQLLATLTSFRQRWRALWARFGEAPGGRAHYRRALADLQKRLQHFKGRFRLPNEMDAVALITQAICEPALDGATTGAATAPAVGAETKTRPAPASSRRARLERPVIIVAAPRSGSTMLFEALSRSPDVYTVGGESHAIIEGIDALQPFGGATDSNRLTAAQLTPALAQSLTRRFVSALRDRDGAPIKANMPPVRMVEKTPKNALRVPFLDALFPDALFIYLYRDPRENISSIIDAWHSGRFVTYRSLPDCKEPWSLLLVPQWRDLLGAPVHRIAAQQWLTAHQLLLDDLAAIDPSRIAAVRYDDLLRNPAAEIQRLWQFAGLRPDAAPADRLPLSRYTLSPPDPDKWRRHEAELAEVLPSVAQIAHRASAFIKAHRHPPRRPTDQVPAAGNEIVPLRCMNTSNWSSILQRINACLLISSPDSGQLLIARARDDSLNVHIRELPRPTAIAASSGKLAVLADGRLRVFRQDAQALARLVPPGQHDACFVPEPASEHDVEADALALAGNRLWVLNQTSGTVGMLADGVLEQRWQADGVLPGAGCRLSGMAAVDDAVRYVTAFGPGEGSGVLIDIRSHRVLARGLQQPGSPCSHRERIFLLEAVQGQLLSVDAETGEARNIATLPGYAHGLCLEGELAFVGVSARRGGTVRPDGRCGVWIVHWPSQKIAGFLHLEAGVEAVHQIALLHGSRFPEIVLAGTSAAAAT